MTEESEGTSSAPGSGAGDAAPTQAIPRIPKPAAKKAPAKKPAAKKSVSNGEAHSDKVQGAKVQTGDAQTDKGRPREITPPTPVKPSDKTSPEADKKRLIEPVGGPQGRPLTAADYARTTKASASSTAVIPAVKDKDSKETKSPKSGSSSSTTLAPSPASSGGSGRRASLRLTHVDPWSVTRLAFAISVALMIVFVVAAAIFWLVLDAAGVWGQINDSFTSVLSDDSSSFNVKDYFGLGRVLGLTLVLSAVNVVLMTALATIGAHLYNLAAQLMGGVEVTFAEEN